MTETSSHSRVVFRADASIQIGSGHVMRCLALTNAVCFIKSTQAESHHVQNRY